MQTNIMLAIIHGIVLSCTANAMGPREKQNKMIQNCLQLPSLRTKRINRRRKTLRKNVVLISLGSFLIPPNQKHLYPLFPLGSPIQRDKERMF